MLRLVHSQSDPGCLRAAAHVALLRWMRIGCRTLLTRTNGVLRGSPRLPDLGELGHISPILFCFVNGAVSISFESARTVRDCKTDTFVYRAVPGAPGGLGGTPLAMSNRSSAPAHRCVLSTRGVWCVLSPDKVREVSRLVPRLVSRYVSLTAPLASSLAFSASISRRHISSSSYSSLLRRPGSTLFTHR